MSRVYLTLQDVLRIHKRQLERYGGADGVRNADGLEAAVSRPQQGYYADILGEAAALWESLSQNHPFIDGNKRTAFMSVDVFLRINGHEITARPQDVVDFIYERFDQGEMAFGHLERWLRDNARERS